jgi:hypothetical protein
LNVITVGLAVGTQAICATSNRNGDSLGSLK